MYEKNVALGGTYLDWIKPGWYRTIDLRKLNIQKWGGCVLSMVVGELNAWREIRCNPLLAEQRGFLLVCTGRFLREWLASRAYAELTKAWKREILRRREVDAVMTAAIETVDGRQTV